MDVAERLALADLYSDYAACLDEGRLEEWPEFFTEDCLYRVVPRENYERGYPLSTLAFESKGMLKDRVYSVVNTLFHAPYYQRHIVAAPRIRSASDGVVRAEANYVVIRTRHDQPSEVFNAGRYIDVVVQEDGRYKFRERLCVFDSELIPNSIIYPI